MKKMMAERVIPKLLKTFQVPVIYHKMIQTIGQGESFLAEKISDWETSLPSHIKLAYLPSLGGVKLRLTCFGENLPLLEKEADALIETLKEYIGPFIFGYGPDPIEVVLGNTLREKKLTIAVAESATPDYARAPSYDSFAQNRRSHPAH